MSSEQCHSKTPSSHLLSVQYRAQHMPFYLSVIIIGNDLYLATSFVFTEGRLKFSSTLHYIWGTKLGSALVQKMKINGNNIIACDI